MLEIIIEIAKLFKYMFLYIKNCRKWQMHILGVITSIAIIIYIPKSGMLGCTTMEWLTVLIPVNILFSGVISAWVYSKATSSEEDQEVESCYKNEIPPAYEYEYEQEQPKETERFNSKDTLEEGIEEITPLENGGFRRCYKIRRVEK